MEKKVEATPDVPASNAAPAASAAVWQFFTPKLLGVFIVVIVLGVASGYVFSKKGASTGGNSLTSGSVNSSSLSKGAMVGSNDTKAFKDSAQGDLKKGGIEGEGQFHLVRPGGDSQNVYLTSSSVDLSKMVGKKIKVWGETQKAQTAGWLMDVGRVQILE